MILREQFELFIRELETQLVKVDSLAVISEQQRQRDFELVAKEQNLRERELELGKQNELFATEKEFQIKSSIANKKEEESIAKSKSALESQRLNLVEKEKQVDEKLKLGKIIDERMADLVKRETELERQKEIDRIRKEMLDGEEAKNKATAERLKKFTLQ